MSMVPVTVSAENSFTDWIGIEKGSLLVTGTFVGTVTLQVKQATSGNIIDLDTVTAAGLSLIDNGGGELYRAGIKTGEYTSGTAYITLNSGL